MKKVFLILFLFSFALAFAQDGGTTDFSTEQAQNQEIYVQLDKPFYLSGEKMWYSLFNTTADEHKLIFGRRFMEFALIDRNKQIVIKERIKVEDGRSAGQVQLPAYLASGNYMLVISYPFEEIENYLYRKVIPIHNPTEVVSASADQPRVVEAPASGSSSLENEYVTVVANKRNYKARERASISINLKGINAASLSVVVRERKMSTEGQRDIRSVLLDATNPEVKSTLSSLELMNYREHKPLNWSVVSSHGLLLYEVLQESSLATGTIPYAYVAEDQVSMAIFEVRPGQFVLDGTELAGDQKTFFFNNFSFGQKRINNMTHWTYRDIAENAGEMKFSWIVRPRDYAKVFDNALLETPQVSNYITDYAQRMEVLGNIYRSQAYEPISDKSTGNEEKSKMDYVPIRYFKTEDYSEMASVPEFLKEVVGGMKVWDTPKKKDIKVSFSGGRYEAPPMFLVDGIPTLDIKRVFAIEMSDVSGIGIMKDPQNKIQRAETREVANFGYFGSSGVVVIHLKEAATNPFQKDFNEMLSKRLYIRDIAYPEPDYKGQNLNSFTPDFRPVLYWNPLVRANRGRAQVNFMCSDDVGVYEVIVEGIGENGEVIHARQSITLGNPVLFSKN